MNPLMPLTGKILMDHLMDAVLAPDHLTGQKKLRTALSVLAGVSFVLGGGFILYGFYLWLLHNYSSDIAAMITGLACLVFAGASLLILWLIDWYTHRRLTRMREEVSGIIQGVIESAADELSEPIKENPKTALLASVLVGVLAGSRLR
ncbi:MAG: hypothetical protein LRZ85_02465 [Alphaproteobacteria bacterium]|nr:hypothetical protein [Alphaproteobacteria bacterium]